MLVRGRALLLFILLVFDSLSCVLQEGLRQITDEAYLGPAREPNTEELTETRSWKGCLAVITVLDLQVALRLTGGC